MRGNSYRLTAHKISGTEHRKTKAAEERLRRSSATVELDVDMIKRDGVFEDDLARDIVGDAREIAFDDLARLGPGRIRVRKVGCPHVVRGTE